MLKYNLQQLVYLKPGLTNLYGIKGYSQVNNYRPEKRGGGVSLFFNESLEYCRRNDLSFIIIL